MEKGKINMALEQLVGYVEEQDFMGYDPYDTLNSWVPFHWLGKWGRIFATQIQKRNPVNIRPVLGIRKDFNPKAMALFLQAYSILYSKTGNKNYLENADYLYAWLTANFSKGYSGYCWGYNFPWASTAKFVPAYVPTAVVTGIVCKAMQQYYEISQNTQVREMVQGASEFVRNDLDWTRDHSGICISYSPVTRDVCFNASLLAAEVLMLNFQLNEDWKGALQAIQAVDFVVHRQKGDGLWAYSENLVSGEERIQTDFHQGYILESIYRIMKRLDSMEIFQVFGREAWSEKKNHWMQVLRKGCRFYKEEQFFDDGRSLWRVPRELPVEIHNQAQGIITFQVLEEICPEYSEFPNQIASWTIENMMDPKGFFYYHKKKFYTIKIPYMRWSQAWMLLALAHLVE